MLYNYPEFKFTLGINFLKIHKDKNTLPFSVSHTCNYMLKMCADSLSHRPQVEGLWLLN